MSEMDVTVQVPVEMGVELRPIETGKRKVTF